MARRHNLTIDGKTVIEMQNVWLPPTTSTIVHLQKGQHQVTAELAKGDAPVLYYKVVNDETVFHSPVATAVDYTVFIGSADEIIASYRELTGKAPSSLTGHWAISIAGSGSTPLTRSCRRQNGSVRSSYLSA